MNLELKKIISQLWSTCKHTFPIIDDTIKSDKNVYSSNKTEEIIEEKLNNSNISIESVFDEDSTNAVANNILLNFFKTGSLSMKELVNGDITLNPTWEFGALNEKGENNDTSTRIRTRDYIEIDDNPITISALTSSVGFAYCLYNSNKELSGGQTSKYQTDSVTIESSDTIKYIRVWSNTINVNKATELISIVKNIKTDEKVIVNKKLMYNKEEIDNMDISSYWKDKTLIFTGDSIPHGQTMQGNVDKPYPNIVAEKLGMKLINYSIGGSTFACKEDYGGAGLPDLERICLQRKYPSGDSVLSGTSQ